MSDLHSEILTMLDRLPGTVSRMAFGHKGYAVGTSLFAFLDEDGIVVKTLRFKDPSAKLPKGFSFFGPLASGREWTRIPLTDSLREIDQHWSMFEESYQAAVIRDMEKTSRPTHKASRSNRK